MRLSPIDLFLDSFRPTIESVMLGDYAAIKEGGHALDIGCGNGYLPHKLASRFARASRIVGIDIQEDLIVEANQNLEAFPRLQTRRPEIHFHCADIRSFAASEPFDAIVSNPPFFDSQSGRHSPSPGRKSARHDETLSMDDLLNSANALLAPGGTLYVVYPANRWGLVEKASQRAGLAIIDQRHHADIRARSGGIMLAALRRGAG